MFSKARLAPKVDWRDDLPEKYGSVFRFNGSHRWIEGAEHPEITIQIERLHLLRKTPKGGWYVLEGFQNQEFAWKVKQSERLKRFILDTGRKRYAYPSKRDAWNSFMIRTRKRVQHCKNALNVAESLNLAIEQYEVTQ